MMKSNHAVISYYDGKVSSAHVLVTSYIHIIKNAILVTVTVVAWSRK